MIPTGRAARLDDYAGVSGAAADVAREFGFRAAVGAPISVEGRLWGVMAVASTHEQPLPADTEARLAGFTELAATAIASAQTRVELRGVAAETGRLLKVEFALVSRYDTDGLATFVGGRNTTDPSRALPLGLRVKLEGQNMHT